MQYRRRSPGASPRTSPIHTQTYTNAMTLDSWSISRDNTIPLVSLCVHRDEPTIPRGALCIHGDATSHKPTIKMPPTTFLPHLGLYVLKLHILQETARLSVSARHVRGSILRNFCHLVAYLCRVVSLRQ